MGAALSISTKRTDLQEQMEVIYIDVAKVSWTRRNPCGISKIWNNEIVQPMMKTYLKNGKQPSFHKHSCGLLFTYMPV